MIAGGNAQNRDTKTYRDRRLVPHGDDALEVVRQNATTPREPTRESEDPGAAPAMEETYPIMPHLEFSEEELEIRRPSLKAPAEEKLIDHLKDCDDNVYNHGLALARKIQQEVDELGRRRHATRDEKIDKEDQRRTNTLGAVKQVVVDEGPLKRVVFAFTAGCAALKTSIAAKEAMAANSPPVTAAATTLLSGASTLPPRHFSPVSSTTRRTARVRPRARRSAAGGVRECPSRKQHK